MKNILYILALFTLQACSNDNASSGFALPPETQTGTNTFGVTINNKVYIPRDPTGVNLSGQQGKGVKLLGGGVTPNEYTELVVVDGASPTGFKITIHLQNLFTIGVYQLKQSNFQDQADSVLENHIFFKIWDNDIKNYAYYGSIENQGSLVLKRNSNGIISGNFSGKFVRYDNSNEFITITDGRFDINSFTVQNHPFP